MFSILSNFTLFLLIFDLAIPGLGRLGSAPVAALLSVAVLLSRGFSPYLVRSSLPLFRKVSIIYSLILFAVAVRTLFANLADPSFFLASARSTVIYLASLLYVLAFIEENTGKRIINVFAFNGIVCLVAGTVPSVLEVVHMFKLGDTGPDFIPYRNAFLSGSGFYGIGAPYAVALVFAVVNSMESKKIGVLDYGKLALIAVAGLLAARTVFVGVILSLAYAAFKRPRFFLTLLFLLALAAVLLLTFENTAIFSDWIFEIFVSDSQTKTGTASTDALLNHYFIPDISSFVFGDGKYSDGDSYYMHTDAGYMRQLLFGGVLILGPILYIPWMLGKISGSRAFQFAIVPLAYMLHIKGNFIYNSPSGMPLLILLAFWMHHSKYGRFSSSVKDLRSKSRNQMAV